MDVKHTPKPWHGCRGCDCPCGAIWDSSGEIHLATAFDETALGMDAFGSDIGVTRSERIANARLIVAAPDLLAACEEIVAMNVQYCINRYGDAQKAESMACVTTARAAIARATETPHD